MSKHINFKFLREVRVHEFKIIYSGHITFVYVGKEGTHQYMQCEVSMNVDMGRIANQRKYQNGRHLKTVRITK